MLINYFGGVPIHLYMSTKAVVFFFMTKEACSRYAAERLMATPGEGVQTEFEVEDDSD